MFQRCRAKESGKVVRQKCGRISTYLDQWTSRYHAFEKFVKGEATISWGSWITLFDDGRATRVKGLLSAVCFEASWTDIGSRMIFLDWRRSERFIDIWRGYTDDYSPAYLEANRTSRHLVLVHNRTSRQHPWKCNGLET